MTISAHSHPSSEGDSSSFSLGDSTPFDVVIRSILISRAQKGATIQELRAGRNEKSATVSHKPRDDYYEHTGEKFPIEDKIPDTLEKIPEVTCTRDRNGTYIFNIKRGTQKTQHILDMVRKQKPSRKQPQDRKLHTSSPFSSRTSSDDLCFFNDNYRYLNRSQRRNSDAQLYNFQLLGDDFFLSMARMELKSRFTPGHRILQSGLCISGQTIADATRRVETTKNLSKHIIVNIGSVDILHGHDIMDMKQQFCELMDAFQRRNITPIITNLAPLANYCHKPALKRNLERFNDFLADYFNVIDLWSVMVNHNRQILYECYQTEARYVTGSNQPHVLWNKIGRQRILNSIKKTF